MMVKDKARRKNWVDLGNFGSQVDGVLRSLDEMVDEMSVWVDFIDFTRNKEQLLY